MATLRGANFWVYFASTDEPDRVRCKFCKKCLISKRRFNLKQHLKHKHKIEVRLEKKRGLQQPHPIATSKQQLSVLSNKSISPAHEIYENSPFELKVDNHMSTRTFESESFSVPPINIKQEIVQEALIERNSTDRVEHGAIPQLKTFNDKNNINRLESSTSKEANREESSYFPANFVNHDLVEPILRNSESRRSSDVLDPLDESTSSSKDNFECRIKRKKLVLEIEFLEMQNYKMKLELWEKERQLQLPASKYTRNIKPPLRFSNN